MRYRSLLYGCLFSLAVLFNSFGQEQKPKNTPTAKVKRRVNENTNDAYRFPPHYKSIYKKNTKDIMYGNSCATSVTRKMGFEYVVSSHPKLRNKTSVGMFFNNLWVKTYLVFTQTPWWKSRLKKKLKECKNSSGDLVG